MDVKTGVLPGPVPPQPAGTSDPLETPTFWTEIRDRNPGCLPVLKWHQGLVLYPEKRDCFVGIVVNIEPEGAGHPLKFSYFKTGSDIFGAMTGGTPETLRQDIGSIVAQCG